MNVLPSLCAVFFSFFVQRETEEGFTARAYRAECVSM